MAWHRHTRTDIPTQVAAVVGPTEKLVHENTRSAAATAWAIVRENMKA